MFIIIFTLLSASAFALEDVNLARSPRALLMGDAYTAIADDEFTLFYNPAILARHNGFTFTPVNININVTNALADLDRFENIPSDPSGMASQFMDLPIYLGAGWTPGFKMGNFGLSAFYSDITNINILNQITPNMNIDYRADNGFIFGYAHPLLGTFDEEGGGTHLAVGVSGKFIQRKGIYGIYPLTSTSLLDAANAGDIKTIMDNLGLAEGSGWGWDVGLDYAKKNGATTITAGLVAKDITTTIDTKPNDTGSEVVPQENHWNLGFGWKQEAAGFHYQLSVDFRNLENLNLAMQSRTRFGVELGLPVLSLFAGYSQGYYSWGLRTNLLIFDMVIGVYDVEVGERLLQQKASRAVIYFSLFDFHFDP
jgi:hypothetical protein